METYLTLWDAIRECEEGFSDAVHSCVSDGLSAIGEEVYLLEWANASIGFREEIKAA